MVAFLLIPFDIERPPRMIPNHPQEMFGLRGNIAMLPMHPSNLQRHRGSNCHEVPHLQPLKGRAEPEVDVEHQQVQGAPHSHLAASPIDDLVHEHGVELLGREMYLEPTGVVENLHET